MNSLSNKNIVNSYAIIACVCTSLLLFLIRLYICQYVTPWFYTSDYYGYIELGKNIFNKLDFTVDWELGNPTIYPPFFSILIYPLSFFTRNFIASIQYISIFSVSFYLIPLFFLVKNILNIPSAILAVVFAAFLVGIGPCFSLWSDYFYSFLILMICWLIWDTLSNRNQGIRRYIFAGILIGIAYLTKYSAVIFCFASVASILYYFTRYQHNIKAGFKMSAFLLLGAVPIVIIYHLLLYSNNKTDASNISAYTFFDGNYVYEGDRNIKIIELNTEGTEFSHLTLVKSKGVLRFFLENPSFVFHKYIWGLKQNARFISFYISPSMRDIKENFGVIFQSAFIFLLIISGMYFKWHFNMMHILLFTIGMIFTPFFHIDMRYLLPFMPLYFVLWLFILNAGYRFAATATKNKIFLKLMVGLIFVSLASAYCVKGYKKICMQYAFMTEEKKQDEKWRQTALWIKNDAMNLPKRARIMSQTNYLAYLADASFIRLPYEFDLNRLINFAALKGVNYLVIDAGPSKDSWWRRPGCLAHEIKVGNDIVVVLKI